ncbi:MAG: hypothetical protein JSV03_09300 [Planctomycetota bacterium]|nr:MAG: hypothetical protein JSV03_09300 [Planctomycetota bacterium]
MHLEARKVVILSVVALLCTVGTATANMMIAQHDFEDIDLEEGPVVLHRQMGGIGWKDSRWSASNYSNKRWMVEEEDPAAPVNQRIRSVGTKPPTAWRTFIGSGSMIHNQLDCKFDLAVDGSFDGNFDYRIYANERTAGSHRRIDVQFKPTGEILAMGIQGDQTNPVIGYWDGTDGFPDATNNFVTMELLVDKNNYTYDVTWGGQDLGTWNWRSSADNNLTDVNMIGGNSGSDDEAVPGGVMIDNLNFEGVPDITLALDILPDDDPNLFTVNTQNKGRLPIAILGSEDYDINLIDVNSISIAGVVLPVKTPKIGGNVVIHVSRRELILALGLDLLEPGTVVPVTVLGLFSDGRVFEATDYIVLVERED